MLLVVVGLDIDEVILDIVVRIAFVFGAAKVVGGAESVVDVDVVDNDDDVDVASLVPMVSAVVNGVVFNEILIVDVVLVLLV